MTSPLSPFSTIATTANPKSQTLASVSTRAGNRGRMLASTKPSFFSPNKTGSSEFGELSSIKSTRADPASTLHGGKKWAADSSRPGNHWQMLSQKSTNRAAFNRTADYPATLSTGTSKRKNSQFGPERFKTPTICKETPLEQFDPNRLQEEQNQKDYLRLAYELYDPVMKFQNESIIKRNLDSFMDTQGSRLGNEHSILSKEKESLVKDFNQTRLKLATAGTKNRASLLEK